MTYLLYAFGVIVLAVALMPKTPSPQRPSLEDLTAPTVKQGKPITKVFGQRIITGPNIVWYGDIGYNQVRVKSGK
jgi:hypothetical protein